MPYEYDLKDIKAKEVSLVDRAAIKRKFLLFKRKEGEMGAKGQGLGLEEMRGQEIPPPVLKAILKMTQSAIERLISLASKLEEMQMSEGEGEADAAKQDRAPLPEEFAKEFRAIMGILESVLQKYPSAAQKNETEDQDGKGDGALEKEKLEKSVESLTAALEAVTKKIEDLEKRMATPTPPPATDSGKEVVKNDDKGEQDKADKVALTKALDEVKEEVKKMLETRAVDLTKMFQDAAKEEFGKVVSRVEAIEKALTGDDAGKPPAASGDDYKRTYGTEEVESKVTDEGNPFFSMFESVKDF